MPMSNKYYETHTVDILKIGFPPLRSRAYSKHNLKLYVDFFSVCFFGLSVIFNEDPDLAFLD